jgi:hypothetical protein
MHDEWVREEEMMEDIIEGCVMDNLLLYMKSLLLIMAALY